MTPTYPKWGVSHIEGISKTTMEMFNKRKDVKWYEIGVFNKEWEALPFVTSYKVLELDYLSHVKFDVYITDADVPNAEYLCSRSKLRSDKNNQAMIATRICSRFK